MTAAGIVHEDYCGYPDDCNCRKVASSGSTTRVRILLNVTVDTEAWCAEYGTEPREVAADVRRYIGNTVREQLRVIGVTA